MIRPVRLYPDPVLMERCAAATPDEAERLVTDLVDTMRSLPGCVGLAAPQIGEAARVLQQMRIGVREPQTVPVAISS